MDAQLAKDIWRFIQRTRINIDERGGNEANRLQHEIEKAYPEVFKEYNDKIIEFNEALNDDKNRLRVKQLSDELSYWEGTGEFYV